MSDDEQQQDSGQPQPSFWRQVGNEMAKPIGAPSTAKQPVADPPGPPKKSNKGAWIALACILVAAPFVGLLGGGNDPSPNDTPSVRSDDSGGPTMAKIMCHEFIERDLRSPSSADYSDEIATGNDPTYTVRGVVDSDNAFGAAIRNYFACRVTYTGNDNWQLLSLHGLVN